MNGWGGVDKSMHVVTNSYKNFMDLLWLAEGKKAVIFKPDSNHMLRVSQEENGSIVNNQTPEHHD